MPQRHYEPDGHHPHLATERHQISPMQSKRPRIGMESPQTPTLGMYSNQPFRVPGHTPSLTQASPHGHIQAQQSSYTDYPPFAPPSSSQTFGSLHGSSRDRATSGSDRAISGMTGGRTVYGNITAASPSTSGRGPDFSFLGSTDDGRRRSTTTSSGGSSLGLDWPSSKPGHMAQPTERDRRSEPEKERAVERTASGSSGGANPAGSGATSSGGSGWLDFLSGNGTTNSGVATGVPSTSSAGGLSWERGTSNRTRTGGPEDGAGEIDALSLFGLNSSETKKEVG
ncbi:hypothetical protein C0992_009435 [Termitomyces sp. T32_za158]|nr:hypothetical protein C0992_009435 [Termitomyces sp. T32_za158]